MGSLMTRYQEHFTRDLVRVPHAPHAPQRPPLPSPSPVGGRPRPRVAEGEGEGGRTTKSRFYVNSFIHEYFFRSTGFHGKWSHRHQLREMASNNRSATSGRYNITNTVLPRTRIYRSIPCYTLFTGRYTLLYIVYNVIPVSMKHPRNYFRQNQTLRNVCGVTIKPRS